MLRPADLCLGAAAGTLADACAGMLDADRAATRAEVAAALAEGHWPSETLHDADLDAVREQFRRFTGAAILPYAHGWHLANALIPDATVQAMADLGTFGVCIPEAFGGLGLELGSASCRGRVCPYVSIAGDAVAFKNKKMIY